jgi:hypothetical protein
MMWQTSVILCVSVFLSACDYCADVGTQSLRREYESCISNPKCTLTSSDLRDYMRIEQRCHKAKP